MIVTAFSFPPELVQLSVDQSPAQTSSALSQDPEKADPSADHSHDSPTQDTTSVWALLPHDVLHTIGGHSDRAPRSLL
jgi:hypothetical protein